MKWLLEKAPPPDHQPPPDPSQYAGAADAAAPLVGSEHGPPVQYYSRVASTNARRTGIAPTSRTASYPTVPHQAQRTRRRLEHRRARPPACLRVLCGARVVTFGSPFSVAPCACQHMATASCSPPGENDFKAWSSASASPAPVDCAGCDRISGVLRSAPPTTTCCERLLATSKPLGIH